MAVHDINNLDWKDIKAGDIFMLDANVLHWLYSGYTFEPYIQNKSQQYSNFIGKLLSMNVKLGASAGNVQEALHLIEKSEFELYKKNNKHLPIGYNLKKFRNETAERKKVMQKTNAEYVGISSVCEIYGLQITNKRLQSYISTMTSLQYDPIDYFVAENCCSCKRVNFITDDRDFRVDSRLEIYTLL